MTIWTKMRRILTYCYAVRYWGTTPATKSHFNFFRKLMNKVINLPERAKTQSEKMSFPRNPKPYVS